MPPWLTWLLLASAPALPPPEVPTSRVVRPATLRERREAVDSAQLALGEWGAARRELLRELEALRRTGRRDLEAAWSRWHAADVEAEVQRIQEGLNAARARLARE